MYENDCQLKKIFFAQKRELFILLNIWDRGEVWHKKICYYFEFSTCTPIITILIDGPLLQLTILGAIFILRKGVLRLFWNTHPRKDIFTK